MEATFEDDEIEFGEHKFECKFVVSSKLMEIPRI